MQHLQTHPATGYGVDKVLTSTSTHKAQDWTDSAGLNEYPLACGRYRSWSGFGRENLGTHLVGSLGVGQVRKSCFICCQVCGLALGGNMGTRQSQARS